VTPNIANKASGPKFGETVYISEVNGARKVKSDAQVAMNKIQIPCIICFHKCGWEGRCPELELSKLLELSETSRARKLILGLQVNIDKANSRRYCVTR